ncbi:hypothetical protein MIMGU_mgv1a001064mg [Erythranthe guttata]|uniref:NB-ARC domain-containing protein n=1 Tax=Erythranthe guttata TaxID=4155 RepID=A0A022Q184_ERYGU|nr:hypothetical protein MIMGU_mgv1a001064mg [Erythranthe guttata]
MAAYAALLSLKYIIQQIQLHPRPPISLDQNQVVSLTKSLNFLQDFLEGYSYGSSSISREAVDVLESRIKDAAHAAEDIIETRIVDQIRGGGRINSVDFYQDLEKVIQEMGFIKKDVMEIKEKNIGIIEDRLHINPSTLGGSSSSPLPMKQIAVVGLDDQLIEVMDKLTERQSNLRIIPIVGMGGIGKTTLAINAYTNPLITEQFDIRAWVTISQTYNVREILVEILLCASKDETRKSLSGKSEGQLGERVHKSLYGRRYLIVLDDIWSVEVWDKVKRFFPDNGQGSRVMITTRLSNIVLQMIGSQLIGSHGLVMDLLDDDRSCDLMCATIFGKEEDCPVELEEIGKKIAKNCKGLPLSIVVIGGLLAKLNPTRENWEYISENLNSIVNVEDNERCLKVLLLSYHYLPVHLKPCFLYMGVFPEDSNIRVPRLVKLWVSEGFLKPIRGKSLEVVSGEYLEDLCDRNLIRVHQRGTNGRIKFCKIHDLMRELCLREAEKEKFLYVRRPHDLNTPQGIINTQRRICIHQSTTHKVYLPKALRALQSVPLARSLCFEFEGVLPSLDHCRLLRVLRAADTDFNSYGKNTHCTYTLEDVFQLVNSRYLAVDDFRYENLFRFPSSVYLLWNLQTLIVTSIDPVVAPSEIWKMTQLRHVLFPSGLEMPDPPLGGQDGEFVLGNLQTLSLIRNFKCGEEVVKRIPNITKLKICYEGEKFGGYLSSYYCLKNLGRLGKLESFDCYFDNGYELNRNDMLQNFIIPNSIKKLTLSWTYLKWEDMKTKIGWLPNLEVLKLKYKSFLGGEWETVEGQFCNLRFLQICEDSDLEWWTTDSTHFPRLEQLKLWDLYKLKEIPSCIGEIPTLGSIELIYCSKSAVISAKEILDEQEDLGNTRDFLGRLKCKKPNST